MNDTVCPKCGHKALSVATRCPRCGQAFDTRYYQHSSQGPRRKLAIPGLLIAGVVLMILAANAVWRLPGTTSGRPTQSGALAPSPAPQPGPEQKVAAPAGRADSLAVAPSRERTPASDPPPPIQTGNRAPAPIPAGSDCDGQQHRCDQPVRQYVDQHPLQAQPEGARPPDPASRRPRAGGFASGRLVSGSLPATPLRLRRPAPPEQFPSADGSLNPCYRAPGSIGRSSRHPSQAPPFGSGRRIRSGKARCFLEAMGDAPKKSAAPRP